MKKINIGKDFSPDPAGRFNSDGPGSGEVFREEVLRPMIDQLKGDEKIVIILDDGVEGYGSSFLAEGFAGMVKYGYIKGADLLAKLDIQYEDEDFKFYKNRIIQYITEAKYASEIYAQ
jgi:hypothetical protein